MSERLVDEDDELSALPNIDAALDALIGDSIESSLRSEAGLSRHGLKERHGLHLFARDVEIFRRLYPANSLASAVRSAFHHYVKLLKEKHDDVSKRRRRAAAEEASGSDLGD